MPNIKFHYGNIQTKLVNSPLLLPHISLAPVYRSFILLTLVPCCPLPLSGSIYVISENYFQELYFIFKYSVTLLVCTHTWHDSCMEVKRQLEGLSSFPPCGF